MEQFKDHIKQFLFFTFITLLGAVLTVAGETDAAVITGKVLLVGGVVAVIAETVSFVRA